MSSWDHPATAERYERFCRNHGRYRRANDVLVREAAIVPGLRLLDFGAGTGRTASAALPRLGRDGRVVCVEPAAAMRDAGRRRLRDRRVTWLADLSDGSERTGTFDRVLAGAVVWQLDSLDDCLGRLTARLRPGGALAFNVPALYLGEPDEPGGGGDPLLLDLVTCLLSETAPRDESSAAQGTSPPRCRSEDVETALRRLGLRSRTWEFHYRLTQVTYARWLSIPVVSEGLFPGLDAAERDRRIARALETVDRHSFKWERWRGWTAWKS